MLRNTNQIKRSPSPFEILLAHQKQFNVYPGQLCCNLPLANAILHLLYI